MIKRDAKKIIKIVTLSVFFLFIVAYAFLRSSDLILGVKIKNVNLSDGGVFTESLVKVNGNAKNAVNLTLNGREISIDQRGNFEETIALLPGYNIVSLSAKDKFGNEDEEDYKLMLNQ